MLHMKNSQFPTKYGK